uniref:Ricin B-type lectin domain-containing protein n=1 Tax=Steinernema glaseri TaxID=37863 RepID=A0A1I7ZHJ8_9BILA
MLSSALSRERLSFLALLLLLCGLSEASVCRYGKGIQQNGEKWLERNLFVMQCKVESNGAWKVEVVGCRLPSGTDVPLNGSVEENDSQWNCTVGADGTILLQQGSTKCDGHDIGSRWIDKAFELECTPGGIQKLVACINDDGTKIPVNGSVRKNGFNLTCQQFANGTVILHGTKTVNAQSRTGEVILKCLDEKNNAHDIGTWWIENERFNKTCSQNGAVEIANCVAQDGARVPIGGVLIVGNAKYSCEMTDQGTIRFTAGPKDAVL